MFGLMNDIFALTADITQCFWQSAAARCIAAASTCNDRILHGCNNPWPKTFWSLILTVELGPRFHRQLVFSVRETAADTTILEF